MSFRRESDLPTAYRYNALGTIVTILVTATAWAVCVVAGLNAIGSWSFVAVALFFGLFAIGMTRVCLTRATIKVSDAGVSAEILGIPTRLLSWNDAKKVVKTRAPVALGTYIDSFQVYSEDRGIVCRFFVNICGNIAFDERIRGVRQLLDQINLRAREHAIPLFVWDLQALAKQRSNSGEKRKRGRTELPVEQF